MLTHRFLFLAVFSGLFTLPQLSFAAEEPYYMWKDDNGVVNFSQTIPKEQEATLIEKPRVFGPPKRKAAQEPKPVPVELTGDARSRELNCMIGKKALVNLHGFKNIYLRGPDGLWKEISGEQREEKVRETEQIIADNCIEPS